MADAKTINGYNVKDEVARNAIQNLNTVQLASAGGAAGSIRFGVDSNGKYGYYEAGADTVTPFSEGGDFEETVLWTNPDPTANLNTITITGLPNLSQYDYIGVYCNEDIETDTEFFAAMDYVHFKNTNWAANYPNLPLSYRTSSQIYTRHFAYVSDTSIVITSCYYYESGKTGGINVSRLIPTKIVGLKKTSEPHIPVVKAVDTNWTADKDYDYAIVVGIRGSVPTIGYVGSGTMTQIAVLDGGGQYDRVYRIEPIKSGDQIINYYRTCVIA